MVGSNYGPLRRVISLRFWKAPISRAQKAPQLPRFYKAQSYRHLIQLHFYKDPPRDHLAVDPWNDCILIYRPEWLILRGSMMINVEKYSYGSLQKLSLSHYLQGFEARVCLSVCRMFVLGLYGSEFLQNCNVAFQHDVIGKMLVPLVP